MWLQLGKLLVFRSGKMKLQMGGVLMDVAPGSSCQAVQQCLCLNTAAQTAMKLAEIGHRVVVTPSMDQLLRSGQTSTCVMDLPHHDLAMNEVTMERRSIAEAWELKTSSEQWTVLLLRRRSLLKQMGFYVITLNSCGCYGRTILLTVLPLPRREDASIPDWPKAIPTGPSEKPAEPKLHDVVMPAKAVLQASISCPANTVAPRDFITRRRP